ncbi:MAG: ArnT family glycosyltransferase [Bryobacteraceae bacterium]
MAAYSRPARGPQPAGRRSIRRGSYLIFFAVFALVVFLSHLWALRLPYFWDEAGQYIPAALDLLHGAWIPHSAPPILHPPAVMLYLAAFWKVAGFHPAVTRSAMLLIAAGAVLAAFLLAIELLREVRGVPAFLVAALVCACRLFFAQSMLAQLDAPAMLFTTLALLLFLQDRLRLAAATSVVLVLVKETGVVVPLVFLLWLGNERRWREAAFFVAPLAALSTWIVWLHHSTGHWMGNPGFLQYNLYYPLHPARLAMALFRRVYYLFFANCHWMGTQAILLAWRTSSLFRSRPWRIALWLAAAHVFTVTLLGGAALERYLLPAIPILYTAMVAGLMLLRRVPRLVCSAILLIGVAAGNVINPPYPFPYEDNLAFSDFVRLHVEAAQFLARRFPEARIATAWPMTAELSRPELGFVNHQLRIERLADFSAATIQSIDWKRVDVLVVYSRRWDPDLNFMHWPPIERFWGRFGGYVPGVTSTEAWSMTPYPNHAHFEKRGQWVDVYANPAAARRSTLLVWDRPANADEGH